MEKLFFFIFAFVAVVTALGVVTLRNPVHSALALMVCFFQVACIFVLLGSPFLAVVQIFIYVGAVMVLFLFAVMVLDMRKVLIERIASKGAWYAYILAPLVLIEFLFVAFGSSFDKLSIPAIKAEIEVEGLARALFTTYLLPFEAVSILLLAAMVGAIVLARKRWN
ncbi:MAG: NADH-quinone oxidoreductase subunit J [Deltaproteobacteria bacterium]|nr:NADH-quinone oxidoreductase subunit J [Deltaproteobacteria bacterium]